MKYQIEFKPRATKDLRALSNDNARRVMLKIEGLQTDWTGDVKRLTNFSPEYRLRVVGIIEYYLKWRTIES